MLSTSCSTGPIASVRSEIYPNMRFVPKLMTTAMPIVTRNSTGSIHDLLMATRITTTIPTPMASSVNGTSVFGVSLVRISKS